VSCNMGACVLSCAFGFGDCDGEARNGCERRTNDDADCGRCGTRCPAGAHCILNGTVLGCLMGPALCVGQLACGPMPPSCANDTNPGACGACGTACGGSINRLGFCAGGTCRQVCRGTLADCDMSSVNGCEVDLAASVLNCGACGRVCAMGQRCLRGFCQAP
jgi:hypothetical protein